MSKRFHLAAAGASFVAFAAAFGNLAAPPARAGHDYEFSAEDKAAFTDARIAALRAGLKLTPAQEKNWPALETVLRDVAKARSERMEKWHEKAKEGDKPSNLIERLHDRAKIMSARAGELDKIAEAAKPLYDSLDDAQKRRLNIIFHAAMRMHGHMGHMGMGQMDRDGGEHDDRRE
jgi:hypothetical protein